MVIRRDDPCLSSADGADDVDDGFSKDASIVFNNIRPCMCSETSTATINGKSLDTKFLDLDSSMLHKLHELGEDDITGPAGVNDISQYLEDDESKRHCSVTSGVSEFFSQLLCWM